VINAAADPVHPRRRKLAGRDEGALYDRLLAAQADLARGEDGAGKPMTCSASLLARVAQARPRDHATLARLVGDRHAERFGDAFLAVLREA
jgi:ATP-dependent DNA helicase RecQ